MGQIGEFKALRSAFDHSLEQEIGIWIGIWETFFFIFGLIILNYKIEFDDVS